MYGLRYGTIPIVRTTGGLDDTVVDIRDDTTRANGIKFVEYSATALAKGVRKALTLYAEPELLHRYRQHAMMADFSWSQPLGSILRFTRKPKPMEGEWRVITAANPSQHVVFSRKRSGYVLNITNKRNLRCE